jgi:hypothetical protein
MTDEEVTRAAREIAEAALAPLLAKSVALSMIGLRLLQPTFLEFVLGLSAKSAEQSALERWAADW